MVEKLDIDCTIRGSDRVRLKGKRVRDKFTLCNHESAVKLLDEMR